MVASSSFDGSPTVLHFSRVRFLDILLFIFLAAMLLAGAIGVAALFDSQLDLAEAASQPAKWPWTFLNILVGFFSLLALAAVVAVARHGLTAIWLVGFRRSTIRWYLTAVVGMVVLSALLAQLVLPLLQQHVGISDKISTSDIMRQLLPNTEVAIYATVVVGLLAPFVEELIFRGLVFAWLIGRFPGWVAVFGSAILFGLAHIEPVHAGLAGILGLWLGYTRMKGGSIWPCIVAHMVNNTILVWGMYLFPTL